jgi:two-component system LytT family response regulator
VSSRLRALVVEDEPHARDTLREWLAEVEWITLVGEAADGPTAVERIDALAPDLVFLDVRLPGLSGLEVLARARHAAEVVFTTAHDEFALAAFELGALDYLLKPFGRQRFAAALERARRRLGAPVAAAERARAAFASPLRRIFARTPRGIVPVDVAAILHLQASGDYVELHCGAASYLVHTSLAEIAARLDPEQFVQVHRSHVVNLDAIELLTPYDDRRLELRLRGGARIVASRAASERLRALAR